MGNCCEATNSDYDVINGTNMGYSSENNRQVKMSTLANFNKKNLFSVTESNELKNTNNDTNPKINRNDYIQINSKKKLKLIIIQSKSLPEGKELIITPLGLLNNKNSNQDCLTVFGDYNKNNRTDFVFPKTESDTEQNHAEIKYDKILDLFQIKSLRGNGCFLKIEQKIVDSKANMGKYKTIEFTSSSFEGKYTIISCKVTYENNVTVDMNINYYCDNFNSITLQ